MTTTIPARARRDGARLGVALAAALAACEPGDKATVQVGYRGLGQELVYDESDLRASRVANAAPAPLPAAAPGPAGNWQNVQVLTDVGTGEFLRTMTAMTQWVSPQQGCVYCHNPRNFAWDTLDDGREIYAKIVARRMLQMTREINTDYRTHTGQQGVTCYSCHRGQPVPPVGLWTFTDENQYLRFYLDRDDARVQSYTVNNTPANRSSIKQTENVYGVMIAMSNALGVNCTYCHNSRAWGEWQNAPPTRVIALQGLRMVRDINQEYLVPLNGVLPANRLGPLGDAPKVSCISCHQGVARPLYGAMLARYYPAVWGHGGPWETRPGDTTLAGIVDLRKPDGLPPEDSPRLGPIAPRSYPIGHALPAGRAPGTSTDTAAPAVPSAGLAPGLSAPVEPGVSDTTTRRDTSQARSGGVAPVPPPVPPGRTPPP